MQSGATTELTVLVPMIGELKYNRPVLQVSVDGKRISGLETNFEVRGRSAPWPEPAMLVISDRKGSFDDYDKAVHAFFQVQPQSFYNRRSYRRVTSESDRQWITPEMLPRTWLAYSGLDIVSVPIATLIAMETDARQAILGWVETGGTLLVTDVGEKASESRKLAAVLELAQRAAVGAWCARALHRVRGAVARGPHSRRLRVRGARGNGCLLPAPFVRLDPFHQAGRDEHVILPGHLHPTYMCLIVFYDTFCGAVF